MGWWPCCCNKEKRVLCIGGNISSTLKTALRNRGHTVDDDNPFGSNYWTEDVNDYDVLFYTPLNDTAIDLTDIFSTDWPGRAVFFGEGPGVSGYDWINDYTATTGLTAVNVALFGRTAAAGDADEFNRCPVAGHALTADCEYVAGSGMGGTSGGSDLLLAVWEKTDPTTYVASSDPWAAQNKVGSTDYVLIMDVNVVSTEISKYDNLQFFYNLVEKNV